MCHVVGQVVPLSLLKGLGNGTQLAIVSHPLRRYDHAADMVPGKIMMLRRRRRGVRVRCPVFHAYLRRALCLRPTEEAEACIPCVVCVFRAGAAGCVHGPHPRQGPGAAQAPHTPINHILFIQPSHSIYWHNLSPPVLYPPYHPIQFCLSASPGACGGVNQRRPGPYPRPQWALRLFPRRTALRSRV